MPVAAAASVERLALLDVDHAVLADLLDRVGDDVAARDPGQLACALEQRSREAPVSHPRAPVQSRPRSRASGKQGESGMSENPNIELARRLLAAFEAGDEEVVQELIHPAYRGHSSSEGSSGREGVWQSIRRMRDVFADRRIVAEDLIASGDRVVARVLHGDRTG